MSRAMARDRGGGSASTSDGGAEDAERRRRRVRDEDMLIARAKAIREKIRALEARANVKTHDESRGKSHWEYVLTEMTWLARDFASERDWKLETSRQVSHLAASCEGAPMDRAEAEIGRQKTHCAIIAAEVAEFWAAAWERAKERPLPNATELVEDEEDEQNASDGEDVKMETRSDDDDEGGEEDGQRQAMLTSAGDVAVEETPMEQLVNTPPPSPGMKIINSWASNKLYLAMVEMKRDLVKDAIELKEAKDQKEREKEAKKSAKKQKAAKPTRGRGSKRKDEPEEEDDDGDDGDDADLKSSRIAMAEALEMDGMDMDMDMLAPPTPPLIESFMPVIYNAVPALTELVYRETMQMEAQKFAEYERSLRGWEENERKRARALAEAARYQAEEEAHRETMEQRRAFLAAAAAHGCYFDEEGYMVDVKGRRKKNARGEFIQFGVPGHEAEMDFGVPIPKRSTQMDERRRAKEAKKKRRAGAMRLWSPMEDQLLCAIVHEFGSNWALVTDAFAASAPIKGTFHRAEHCRWRFAHITQLADQEQNKNAIAALNVSKGTARMLIHRALPVEDETVRVHFDRACAVMAKHMKIRRAAQMERHGMDKTHRLAPHRSWREVQMMCEPKLNPVDLAEMTFRQAAPPNPIMPSPNGNVMPGVQRLGNIPMGNVMSTGRPGMPGMAPASGLQRAPSGGVPISMPASGSKALSPGSYNLSGSKTPPVKQTTSMKRKGKRK